MTNPPIPPRRFRTIAGLIVDAIDPVETGVHAYRKLPNNFRFPAFYLQLSSIKYHGTFEGLDATYKMDGFLMTAISETGQDELDDLISPDSEFMLALNQSDIIQPLGRLLTEEVTDYGELEVGTKPLVTFGARIPMHAEV